MLVKKMNTTVGNVEEGIQEHPATYLQVHRHLNMNKRDHSYSMTCKWGQIF